jgi:two-component system LytT family sensor kinase
MSLNNYIDRQIIDKNRGIYFKKGRWGLHAIMLLLFWLAMIVEAVDEFKGLTFYKFCIASLPIIPFILFFYYYCLYLVPYCFKQGQYKKFWLELLLLLLVLPPIVFLIQLNLQHSLPEVEAKLSSNSHLMILGKAYYTFLTSFAGFTSMLYLMELLEEVSTVKETAQHKQEHYTAALNKIKTQINPTFMAESLDGIIHLAETKEQNAAEAVIHFADVLRYRLYKSKSRLVETAQEIAQLHNLFLLQQSFPNQCGNCSLEIEGEIQEGQIVPLTLINLVEPLLNFGKHEKDWSLLMYLLPEETGIQVAIELNATPSLVLEQQFDKIKEDLEQLTHKGINFTIEKEPHNYSLRTCIPIFKNSIA